MAGKLLINQIQLGDSLTASQNFVLQTNIDGTCKLSRGNAGATTQDIFTVDTAGKTVNVQGFPDISPSALPSMVRLNTANGYGTTNTKIRRFTNIVTNQGTDITYTDSATLGGSFTINKAGVYAVSYCDVFTSAEYLGLTLNTTGPALGISSISALEILSVGTTALTYPAVSQFTGHLVAGSVLRAHTQGTAAGGVLALCQFTITRVA